jgi:acetyltransferase
MPGAGGELVEVLRDRAPTPPADDETARRLVDETRIARALRGVRGRPWSIPMARVAARAGSAISSPTSDPRDDINLLLATPTCRR